MQFGTDPGLFYGTLASVIALVVGAGAGYLKNNPRASAALAFTASVVGILQQCDAVARDGIVTPAEEQAVGRATILAYRDGGDTLAAIAEE